MTPLTFPGDWRTQHGRRRITRTTGKPHYFVRDGVLFVLRPGYWKACRA